MSAWAWAMVERCPGVMYRPPAATSTGASPVSWSMGPNSSTPHVHVGHGHSSLVVGDMLAFQPSSRPQAVGAGLRVTIVRLDLKTTFIFITITEDDFCPQLEDDFYSSSFTWPWLFSLSRAPRAVTENPPAMMTSLRPGFQAILSLVRFTRGHNWISRNETMP